MKVLELKKRLQKQTFDPERKGIFTTLIRAQTKDGAKIIIYQTDNQHAGEVYGSLMKNRTKKEKMFAMADAASFNRKHEATDATIELGCNVHARRKFVELKDEYPVQAKEIIKIYAQIYKNDAFTKLKQLSPIERLKFHQEKSKPLMLELHEISNKGTWSYGPNTSLYKAYKYVVNHWERLTGFLQFEGVPLDNSTAERDLKRAIRYRKNSLFYLTETGAVVGDILMSIISTAIENDLNPIEYIETLLKNQSEIIKNPRNWLPWNLKTQKSVA